MLFNIKKKKANNKPIRLAVDCTVYSIFIIVHQTITDKMSVKN